MNKDEKKNKSVILYGAGFRGGRNFCALAEENVHVEAFCDRDAESIPQYYGCNVYTMDKAIKKYFHHPFILSIDEKKAREEVYRTLKERGIEVYDSFEDYFQGKRDVSIVTERCGDKATFQIIPKLLNGFTNLVAYSFGIGFDFSFEKELAEKYNINVYAFDPSPEVVKSMEMEKLPVNMHYYEYGLSDQDGKKEFYLPSSGQDYSEYFASWTSGDKTVMQVYRLKTLMQMFGHDQLDLLKMDIEGSEFLAMPDILSSNIQFKQLCIETHARIFPDSVNRMREFKKMMNDHGYLLVSNGRQEQTYIRRGIL